MVRCAHPVQDADGTNQHCQRVTCRSCGKVLLAIYPRNLDLTLARRAVANAGIHEQGPQRGHHERVPYRPRWGRNFLGVLLLLLLMALFLVIGVKYDLIILVGLSHSRGGDSDQDLRPFWR